MFSYTARLAWRLILRRGNRRAYRIVGLPVLITVSILAATYVLLSQQSLTGSEKRVDQLGDYSAFAFRLDFDIAPGDSVTTRAAREMRDRGLDVDLAVVIPDLPIAGLSEDGVYYRELHWREGYLLDSIRILEGRMPGAPGEVAILGNDLTKGVAVGDELDAPQSVEALRVVGIGESELRDREEVLAADGTWASLPARMAGSDRIGVGAGLGMYFKGEDPQGDMEKAAAILATEMGGSYAADSANFLSAWNDTFTTAEEIGLSPEESWLSRSPLSFWAPCLILLPLLLLACHALVGRRLGVAVRTAIRAGIPRGPVVTAVAGGIHVQLLVSAIVGLGLGIAAAWVAGNMGVGGTRWLGWRSLEPLGAGLVGGWVAGLLLSVVYWFGRTRSGVRHLEADLGRPWVGHIRHVLAMAAVAAAFLTLREISGPGDALRAVLFLGSSAALVAPEVIGLLARAMTRGEPSARLSSRLLMAHRGRGSLLLACVTLLFVISTGFLTAMASFVEVERNRSIPPAPFGTVALDNDDAPALPVPPSVRAAAETVSSLGRQVPVQLWATGSLESPKHGEIRVVEHAAGTLELPGISFAVDSISSAAAALGRPLTDSERSALNSSKVLVIDERVRLEDGEVQLVDITNGSPIARVPAQRMEPPSAVPWLVSTPTVMLTATARALDIPLTQGALLYGDVPADDSQRVLDALIAAGIHAEQAEIHQPTPPLLPPAALLISGIALSSLLVGVLSMMIRGQLAVMRPWASRLQQLGLPSAWSQRVFARQYIAVTTVGAALGVACGYLPIVVMGILEPTIPTPFPALETVTLTAVMVCAIALVTLTGMRKLSATEAVNWQDNV